MFEFDPKDLNGIPLTEEWLVTFGFEYIEEYKWWEIDWCNFTIDLGGEYEFEFAFHPIKYVHQLQNLYFALTGKEL
jgi:hypothetical protein